MMPGLQNDVRHSAGLCRPTPRRSVSPLPQRPVWCDAVLDPSEKTDPRPAVKRELNRARQIAGSNAGAEARTPGHPETGSGAVVPSKAKRQTFRRNCEEIPG